MFVHTDNGITNAPQFNLPLFAHFGERQFVHLLFNTKKAEKKVKFMIPARSMLVLYDARQQQQKKGLFEESQFFRHRKFG